MRRLLILALSACATGWAQSPAVKPLIPSIAGKELYRSYCASCHGADAKGTGPMAASLKTQPADLTRIALRNQGIFPMKVVRDIIAGEPRKGHGSREMPVWGPVFSQVERDVDLGKVRIDNLARYLESIQAMK